MTAPDPRAEEHDGDSTVGAGSTLGIGCLIAVLLLVIVALAARWLFGAW